MEVVNLTPHDIKIVNGGGSIRTYPPTGRIARVVLNYVIDEKIGPLQTYRVTPGEIEGLPDPRKDTIWIVSAILAAMVKRPDVMSPGELVRNAAGKPVACKGLQRWD